MPIPKDETPEYAPEADLAWGDFEILPKREATIVGVALGAPAALQAFAEREQAVGFRDGYQKALAERVQGEVALADNSSPSELDIDPATHPSYAGTTQVEVTQEMRIAGFECEAWDALSTAAVQHRGWPYTCRESADCVEAIYRAMHAARVRGVEGVALDPRVEIIEVPATGPSA